MPYFLSISCHSIDFWNVHKHSVSLKHRNTTVKNNSSVKVSVAKAKVKFEHTSLFLYSSPGRITKLLSWYCVQTQRHCYCNMFWPTVLGKDILPIAAWLCQTMFKHSFTVTWNQYPLIYKQKPCHIAGTVLLHLRLPVISIYSYKVLHICGTGAVKLQVTQVKWSSFLNILISGDYCQLSETCNL